MKITNSKSLVLIAVVAILFSCRKEKAITTAPSQPTVEPANPVLLKDIVIASLPSPFYHFEYNAAGKPTSVSFASGLNQYNIFYDADRISEMRNTIVVNKDRLQYFYDNEGRVNSVRYLDSAGIFYASVNFAYDGSQLIRLDRRVKTVNGLVRDKLMAMSYDARGNLLELTEHRFPVNGQVESTVVDRYEQYDDHINVDGFSLIHNDFFDHLVLLPVVQLQKNNPRKLTRTGDGENFTIDYSYTYSARSAPLTRSGDFVYTSGTNTGQHIHLSSVYTYYP